MPAPGQAWLGKAANSKKPVTVDRNNKIYSFWVEEVYVLLKSYIVRHKCIQTFTKDHK